MHHGHHPDEQVPPARPGPDERESAVVAGFDRVMVVAVTGFTAVGITTLTLAVAGVARPLLVAPVAAALWSLLLVGWLGRGGWSMPPDDGLTAGPAVPGRGRTARTAVVLAGVAVVLASGAHNLRHQGDYVVTDRDPGIYVTGGKWIADHGDLVVDGGGQDLDHVEGVVSWAAGQSETDDDPNRLQVQGAHLFHSVLAVGEWVGGPAGFAAVPAVVGALALAVFFWLALRLLPDWAALLATVALAVDFAWIYTVRSYLSEPTLLLTSFAAAVLLIDAVRDWPRRPVRLLVAGFVAATSLTARVDAGVVVLAFPVLVALLVRRGSPTTRPLRALGWFLAGWVVPLVVAAVDLGLRSPRYLSDLGSEVTLVVAGLVTSGVVAVVVAVSGSGQLRVTTRDLAERLRPWRPRLAVAAVVAVVAVGAFAWFVRPHLGPVRLDRGGAGWRVMESIQVHEGLDPDGTRTYAERSLDRITWYTGPVAIAAGIAGLAVLAWRSVGARLRDAEWVVVGLVVPCLVLYVYAPSIYSDHPWMIRRYVPTAIPGLLLLSAVAVTTLVRWDRPPRAVRSIGAALLAVGLVGYPAEMTWPLRSASWQAGGRDGIERLCDDFDPDDLAVLAADGSTALTLLPAVRSFCDVEAVGLAPDVDAVAGAPVIDEVAAVAAADGREVEVVAPTREVLETLAPDAVDLRTVRILQTSAVGTTIGRPPQAVGDHTLTVWIGTLEPPVA